jgi:hypothetical protein
LFFYFVFFFKKKQVKAAIPLGEESGPTPGPMLPRTIWDGLQVTTTEVGFKKN